MPQEVHVGDVGTRFEYWIRDEDGDLIPIEDVESLTVRFRKPDKSTFDRDLTPDEETDSLAFYIFEDGELDRRGDWKHQYHVETADGAWWSEQGRFSVYPNIEANEGS